MREDGAAAKLQATARGRAARRELEDQKAAATKIAAVQRGKSTRRERQAVREDGAAAKLGGGQQVDAQRSLPVAKPAIKIKVQG